MLTRKNSLVVFMLMFAILVQASIGDDKPESSKSDRSPANSNNAMQIRRILIGPNSPHQNGKPNIVIHGDGALESGKAALEGFIQQQTEEHYKDHYFIGVVLHTVQQGYHGLLGIEDGTGLFVVDVIDDSPAADAGLKQNDLLLKINETPLKTVDDLQKEFKEAKDKDYRITIRRNQERMTLTVSPQKWADLSEAMKEKIQPSPLQHLHSFTNPLTEDYQFELISPGVIQQALPVHGSDLRSEIDELREQMNKSHEEIMKKLSELLEQKSKE